MKREDIEKAALQRSFIETPDAREIFLIKSGFIYGAKWRINSVWHDDTEKPKLGELIIVEVYGKIFEYGKYDVCDTIHPAARWAYMKDLIPFWED